MGYGNGKRHRMRRTAATCTPEASGTPNMSATRFDERSLAMKSVLVGCVPAFLFAVVLSAGLAFEEASAEGPNRALRWSGTTDSLDAAIRELSESVGPRYVQGPQFRQRLAALRKAGVQPGDPEMEKLGNEALAAHPQLNGLRLVFVKRTNFGRPGEFFGYTSYLKRPPAELCVMEFTRGVPVVRTLLRTEQGCLRDPDVSFDGRRVVFAYARDQSDEYHIYEIHADGSGLRQLTFRPPYSGPEPMPLSAGCQDVEPCYLPNGQIALGSTRYVRFVDCVDDQPVTTLFVMDGDGGRLHGISANHVHDWHPSVLNDGRLIYTRWEYTDRSQMWPHKLFVKNPDGSASAAFYGSNSWWPVSMLHARAVPGSNRVLCTLAGHHSDTDQTGEIALVDPGHGREDRHGVVALFPPRKIEAIYRDDPRPNAEVRYTEPYPLSDRWFLVSGRAPGAKRFGLYLADFSGNRLLLYEDASLDCLSVMPLAARPLPPIIPPRTDYRQNEATVVLIDVYRGAGMAGVARGSVKSLRIADFDLRDAPRTGGLRQEEGPSGGHSCPVTALGGSWHVKRIVGTVPVLADGSAAFRIPAQRRVFFQPLDAQGRAIQSMRSWVEAMPGERITCIGCHESPSETPPSASAVLALGQEAAAPRPWYGPARAFGFVSEVQPVLDRHCVRCHNAEHKKGLDFRGDKTNWFSLAYENLRPFVRPIGPQGPAALMPPRSRGAVASPVVDMLLAGHHDVRLDPESLDRLITWIDLNVPYYDNTAVTRPSRGGLGNAITDSGRAVVRDGKPLWDALGGRCGGCHARGFRIDPATAPCQVLDLPKTMSRPCINLTHPEESRILTAPLAKSAGGLGLCGPAVGTSRNDPTYQAALRILRAWHDDLAVRPREDMPGSMPCDLYQFTQSKRRVWLAIEAESLKAIARP